MRNIQIFAVSDFVALVNQTLEYAYPNILIEGEISNFKVSKNRWVYFDIKDDSASVRCFMTVYQLNGLFEDGMKVRLRAVPKLHEQYGFSLTVQQMQPAGEGAIKRAADMLKEKLTLEGLFDVARKRTIPYPPQRIALIASRESAAYGDFVKVLDGRWGGIHIDSYDVQVQGEGAPATIIAALSAAGQSSADVIVLTRGGGSSDDLLAFADERVVRAVAASRIPTIVAIGHERDESLAELAADMRASTPSNAAEILTPDRRSAQASLVETRRVLSGLLQQVVSQKQVRLEQKKVLLSHAIEHILTNENQRLYARKQIIELLDPLHPLKRGYALVQNANGETVRSLAQLQVNELATVRLQEGTATMRVQAISKEYKE